MILCDPKLRNDLIQRRMHEMNYFPKIANNQGPTNPILYYLVQLSILRRHSNWWQALMLFKKNRIVTRTAEIPYAQKHHLGSRNVIQAADTSHGQQIHHMGSRNITWAAETSFGQQKHHLGSRNVIWAAEISYSQRIYHKGSRITLWTVETTVGSQKHLKGCLLQYFLLYILQDVTF